MKKYIFILSLFIFSLIFFLSTSKVYAKLLPQAKGPGTGVKTKSVTTRGISIFPKLRSDRKALNITFGNLGYAKSVDYNLIYWTVDHEEGARGSINMEKEANGATRELLFGTCSKNVCRYHTGIKNMKLGVTSELKSGKKTLKRYRIKV